MSDDHYSDPPRFTDGTYSEHALGGMDCPPDEAVPEHVADQAQATASPPAPGLGGSPLEDAFNKVFRKDKYEEDKARDEYRELQYQERVRQANLAVAQERTDTLSAIKKWGGYAVVGGLSAWLLYRWWTR